MQISTEWLFFTDRRQPVRTAHSMDPSIPFNFLDTAEYSVAVTGDVFRWIIEFGTEELLQKVNHPACSKFVLYSNMGSRCL
jgi:hypothetical protein